jgi:SPP1 family predicted phage head-tail adaptor
MRIGELRKRITIEAEAQTADGAGGYALGWTTVATVWGEIKPLTGRKVYFAQHLEGRVTHQVNLRWDPDATITTDMRVNYNGRLFNIHAVINADERNHWAELLVEEGTAT